MFVWSLSLYNIRNRGVFLLCKITNLLIYSYIAKKETYLKFVIITFLSNYKEESKMENTCVKKGSHLNIEERRMIAILTAEGKSPYAIAKLLGRASNTIRNELKRGTTNIIRGYFEYEGYFPDTGQAVYEKNRLKCRQPMKLKTCKDYIAYVEQEVLEKKRSFACVHAEVIAKGIFNKL